MDDLSEVAPSNLSAPFVLVHGAFHGGWCWREVAKLLRAAGHEVYTPTQTGLGERRHLMSGEISMDTFVKDILNLILVEDLWDVILVGHSFGGRSISGVADRAPERVRRLIYLDGGLAYDGKSRLDAMPEEQRAARLASSIDFDGGVSVPAPPATRFGMSDPDGIRFVERRLTPQPLGAERTPLNLTNPLGNGLPVTFVQSVAPRFPGTEGSAAYARAQSGWRFVELAAGHNAIVTHPTEVAALLLREGSRL